MNSRSLTIRTAVVLALSLIITTTTFADFTPKRRAVNPASDSATALLTGTVLDATTGAPVLAVFVTSGKRSGHTDHHGNFFIKLVPGTPAPLTFARSGYETFTTTVSVRGDEAQTFRLIPKATVNIRTSAGASYDVDPETVEFGYVAPFSGYNKDTKLNLCKGGGESFMPDRTEIKRITGAAQLNDPKCCAQFSIPAINVELKSGGTTTAGFVDACFGYKVDIVAQDHVTALPVYFHFTDLAEVTFP